MRSAGALGRSGFGPQLSSPGRDFVREYIIKHRLLLLHL